MVDLSEVTTRDLHFLKQLHNKIVKNKRLKKDTTKLEDSFQKKYQKSHAIFLKRKERLPQFSLDADLPVIAEKENIKQLIDNNQIVIISGETGSGKTTQLPKICLDLGLGIKGMIAHTQPRRIAAKSVADRIAKEMNCVLGEAVGYQVRFDEKFSPQTYVKLMTDGMLLAETLHDKYLSNYEAIIIDEAHERSLNIDFLLGYLAKICAKRPELKIIITSATIDAEKFSEHFNQAPQVSVSGRTYPVEIRYRPQIEDSDINQNIYESILELTQINPRNPGDILVFLATEREIREVNHFLNGCDLAHTEVIGLFGRLSLADQNKVFHPGNKRRIVLSTNVAETSLTVPRIKYVIDTGTARISRYSLRLKMQRLPIEAISQASANQRAGRCGRVSSGVCIRLYSEEDFLNRSEYTEPEILRTNLSAVILQMLLLHLGAIDDFPFVDPPDKRQINDGYQLLYELKAVDSANKITPLGGKMARFPIDPRFARIIFAAEENACLNESLIILSLLSIQDPRERPHGAEQLATQKQHEFTDKMSDFQTILNLFFAYQWQRKHLSNNKLRKWCQSYYLNAQRMREWRELVNQLIRQCHQQKMKIQAMELPTLNCDKNDKVVKGSKGSLAYENGQLQTLHMALLTGFIDQVGLWDEVNKLYQGPRNRKFLIFPSSVLSRKPPQAIMAANIMETSRTFASTCASIQLDYLEKIASHLTKEKINHPHWSKKQGNVIAEKVILLYGLPIVSGKKAVYAHYDQEMAHQIFVQEALVTGEINTRVSEIAKNIALQEKLETLEDKTRSRGILIDDYRIAQFYFERLPSTVSSTVTLEKWVKSNPRHSLLMKKEDLLEQAVDLSQQDYPNQLEVRHHKLALEYAFNPGDESDGLTVKIPVATLNAFAEDDFDRLVPGMLKEKIEALMRRLPKVYRRQLVPIPDFAKTVHAKIQNREDKPLLALIIEMVYQIKGIQIPEDVFDAAQIDTHHLANYQILDARNKVIAEGRDLSELQKKYAAKASAQFQKSIKSKLSDEQEVTEWLWDELPVQEKLNNGIIAYPALTFESEKLYLRLYDNPDQAEIAHKEGVNHLFARKLAKQIKYIEKNLPHLTEMSLYYQKVMNTQNKPNQQTLVENIIHALIERVCMNEKVPRSKKQFEKALQIAEKELLISANRLAENLLEILKNYSKANEMIRKIKPNTVKKALQRQLDQLIFPEFIDKIAHQHLINIARYLKAMIVRMEKFQREPLKDTMREKEIKPYVVILQTQMQKLGINNIYQKTDTAKLQNQLIDYFYLLEEYRVQVFAQELGVKRKVSGKILSGYFE